MSRVQHDLSHCTDEYQTSARQFASNYSRGKPLRPNISENWGMELVWYSLTRVPCANQTPGPSNGLTSEGHVRLRDATHECTRAWESSCLVRPLHQPTVSLELHTLPIPPQGTARTSCMVKSRPDEGSFCQQQMRSLCDQQIGSTGTFKRSGCANSKPLFIWRNPVGHGPDVTARRHDTRQPASVTAGLPSR